MNTKVLQKNISKVLQNNLTISIIKIILLLATGMIAIWLHYKLRIPLKLPGKHGIVYLAILMSSSSIINLRYSNTIITLGSSLLIISNAVGFNTPFIWINYILVGLILDFIKNIYLNKKNIFLYGLAGSIAWATMPIIKFLIYQLIPLNSSIEIISVGYLIYSIFTHIIFGFMGGILSSSVLVIKNNNGFNKK